ncbi:MAG: VOC family protein [Kordiimonadaceae bacterium]|nr:VOC family protein [Kordiimonadaceae bacterium]
MTTTGKIEWIDLTVDDAENLREFYQTVAGWSADSFDMGEYNDYNMNDDNGDTVAGICHARGGNSGIPPMWIPYISVLSLDDCLKNVERLGGTLINGPRKMPQGQYAIIRDPAGAHCALWQKAD